MYPLTPDVQQIAEHLREKHMPLGAPPAAVLLGSSGSGGGGGG
jgi:hypothetical protein